jgi:branched-chain amino acid transport system substrate-binding protein
MISRKMMLVTGALLASPANAATNYVDVVRDLAARIGPIIGSALACDDIARRRVQMIADKFNQVIRDASPNELDRAEFARLFDANVANDRRLVATAQIGMVMPFSGARKEAGRQMKLGIEAAFNRANDAGGIGGRMLRLIAADDGYEPSRTAEAMKQLYERDQVFGFIGNIGTATAAVAIPYALERRCSSGRSRVHPSCEAILRIAMSSTTAPATPKRPARWFAIW